MIKNVFRLRRNTLKYQILYSLTEQCRSDKLNLQNSTVAVWIQIRFFIHIHNSANLVSFFWKQIKKTVPAVRCDAVRWNRKWEYIGRSPQLFLLSSYLSLYARLPSALFASSHPRHREKKAKEREKRYSEAHWRGQLKGIGVLEPNKTTVKKTVGLFIYSFYGWNGATTIQVLLAPGKI